MGLGSKFAHRKLQDGPAYINIWSSSQSPNAHEVTVSPLSQKDTQFELNKKCRPL